MQNDTSEAMTVFPHLLCAMTRAGITRNELAVILGISRSTLQRRLRGSIEFRWNELLRLHAVFPDVAVSYLLERPKPSSHNTDKEVKTCQNTIAANTADAKSSVMATCAVNARKSSD